MWGFLGLAGSVVCDFGFTSECRGSHETWSSVLNQYKKAESFYCLFHPLYTQVNVILPVNNSGSWWFSIHAEHLHILLALPFFSQFSCKLYKKAGILNMLHIWVSTGQVTAQWSDITYSPHREHN